MKDGRIVSQGSVSDALAKNRALVDELHSSDEKSVNLKEQVDNDAASSTAAAVETEKPTGKLIAEEDIEIGHVAWSSSRLSRSERHFFDQTFPSVKLYLNSLGFAFSVAFLLFTALSEALGIVQVWFLGYWSEQYETSHSDRVNDG